MMIWNHEWKYGLQNFRFSTTAIAANINNIVEKSSHKDPLLTHLINQNGTMKPLKLLSSNMFWSLVFNMGNKDTQ